MRLTKIAVAAMATLSTASFAQQPDINVVSRAPSALTLIGGLTYGGDTLGELHFVDGSTQKVKAGGLLQMGLGYRHRLQEADLQINAVYHFDNASATNGGVDFERFTLEALPYWQVNSKFSVGAGMSFTTGAKLSGDFIDTYKFESSTGVVLSAMMHLDPRNRLDFRYSNTKYTLESVGSMDVSNGAEDKLDGSYIGLIYQYGIGR